MERIYVTNRAGSNLQIPVLQNKQQAARTTASLLERWATIDAVSLCLLQANKQSNTTRKHAPLCPDTTAVRLANNSKFKSESRGSSVWLKRMTGSRSVVSFETWRADSLRSHMVPKSGGKMSLWVRPVMQQFLITNNDALASRNPPPHLLFCEENLTVQDNNS